jgi:hypothetical protein
MMMTNLDMELADSENNNSPCSMNDRPRNKKKRRKAADIPVKKFSGKYLLELVFMSESLICLNL